MADWSFVKSAFPRPLVSVRFRAESDLFLVFCADVDEKEDLKGVTLWGLRKSRGPNPYPLKADLVPAIFQPSLTLQSPGKYSLRLQPLSDSLTILKKSNQYVCMYPFKDEKKVGQVVDVVVDYTITPITMQFTVEGTYKASKEAEPTTLTTTVECPREFTDRLYAFFQNE